MLRRLSDRRLQRGWLRSWGIAVIGIVLIIIVVLLVMGRLRSEKVRGG
jgi:hypothetical protein